MCAALAPDFLDDIWRDEMRRELEQTRGVLRNLLARRGSGIPQLEVKLGWQIDACRRHIRRFEELLSA